MEVFCLPKLKRKKKKKKKFFFVIFINIIVGFID